MKSELSHRRFFKIPSVAEVAAAHIDMMRRHDEKTPEERRECWGSDYYAARDVERARRERIEAYSQQLTRPET